MVNILHNKFLVKQITFVVGNGAVVLHRSVAFTQHGRKGEAQSEIQTNAVNDAVSSAVRDIERCSSRSMQSEMQ